MLRVYFDHNVMIYALQARNVISSLDGYYNNKQIQYVFSPAHIEEIAHANPHTRKMYFAFLKELTKNIEIRPYMPNQPIVYVQELPEAVYERVISRNGGFQTTLDVEKTDARCFGLWKSIRDKSSSDRFFQSKEISNVPYDKVFTINDIREFYQCLYINEPCEYFHKVPGLIPSFDDAYHSYDDLSKGNYQKLEATVEAFMKLLQYIGYHADKKKFEGATHDISHAHYASKADVFVTCDKHFLCRVKAVYHYLGIPTKVMNFKEYCQEFISL